MAYTMDKLYGKIGGESVITIRYEIQIEDLLGSHKIEKRSFKTTDTVLAMRIFKALKASQDVKYIEIQSL